MRVVWRRRTGSHSPLDIQLLYDDIGFYAQVTETLYDGKVVQIIHRPVPEGGEPDHKACQYLEGLPCVFWIQTVSPDPRE